MKSEKILIVEDEPIIALMLKETLLNVGYSNITLAHEYDTALQLINDDPFDLVLLDINLEDNKDGIHLAAVVKEEHKNTSVVFVTGNSDYKTVTRATLVEPDGFIIKPINETELIVLLEIIFHKQSKIDNSLPFNIQNDIQKSLTRREIEILNHIIKGDSNKMIASKLFISVRTVSVHRANLMKKLNAKNTADLVRMSLVDLV